MPRRKKYIIRAKSLSIYEMIKEGLTQLPESPDFDMETIEITVLQKIKPQITNLKKAIEHLKRYAEVNKEFITLFNGEQLINKLELAKMLGITRPTLDKWIKDKFITPVKSKYINNTETYPVDVVLEQLQKLLPENNIK